MFLGRGCRVAASTHFLYPKSTGMDGQFPEGEASEPIFEGALETLNRTGFTYRAELCAALELFPA